jgi:hypothetical protein
VGARANALIGAIDRHVERWVLVDIAELQICVDDELFRLEACMPAMRERALLGMDVAGRDEPVGMKTRSLLTAGPWATMRSTTYGTVDPVPRDGSQAPRPINVMAERRDDSPEPIPMYFA